MIESDAGNTARDVMQGSPNTDAGVAPDEPLRCTSHVYLKEGKRARCDMPAGHADRCTAIIEAAIVLPRGAIRQHRAEVRWWGR